MLENAINCATQLQMQPSEINKLYVVGATGTTSLDWWGRYAKAILEAKNKAHKK